MASGRSPRLAMLEMAGDLKAQLKSRRRLGCPPHPDCVASLAEHCVQQLEGRIEGQRAAFLARMRAEIGLHVRATAVAARRRDVDETNRITSSSGPGPATPVMAMAMSAGQHAMPPWAMASATSRLTAVGLR